MAGRGPASTGRAIRRNAGNTPFATIEAKPAEQPKLPDIWRYEQVWDGALEEYVSKRVKMVWTKQTQAWWQGWGESPLMADATAEDWSFLLDTALLHNEFWSGDVKVAAELRLRVAKFGATPEDRQRLRLQFAPPPKDDDDSTQKEPTTGARARRGPLVAVK
jgi:hypothetical protein